MKKLFVLFVLACTAMAYAWVQLIGLENYLVLVTSSLYLRAYMGRRLNIPMIPPTLKQYLRRSI